MNSSPMQERLRLTHQLHTQIAGPLAYAVRVAHEAALTAADAGDRERFRLVEKICLDVLNTLRSEVLTPLADSCLAPTAQPGGALLDAGNLNPPTPDPQVDEAVSPTLVGTMQQLQHHMNILGFSGECRIDGDTRLVSGERAGTLRTILMELRNNIVKHGDAAQPYVILCQIDDDGWVRLFSGNAIAKDAAGGQTGGLVGEPDAGLAGEPTGGLADEPTGGPDAGLAGEPAAGLAGESADGSYVNPLDLDGSTRSIGLRLIDQLVQAEHGTLETCNEEGQWTLGITLPNTPSVDHKPV